MASINYLEQFSALSDAASVRDFSQRILHLSVAFQEALRRVSEEDQDCSLDQYGLLTEAYGLRARANILHMTPGMHVVCDLNFSQKNLLDELDSVCDFLRAVKNLRALSSILIAVMTFASSLGQGRAKVVNFLFEELCSDIRRFA